MFQLEVKLNDGAQEARAKIAAIRGELPEGIEEPIIQKLDFAAAPIVSLAVRSDTLLPRDLTTLVEKKVKRRFENIPGVGKVDLVGSSKREVNVDIDPTRLEALGMGVDEVIAGIRSENVNTPLGRLTKNGSEFPLRVSGKPTEVSRFPSMVVGQRNGRPVLLGEVADVVDGIEEPRSLALVNGVPAVALDIQKQSGANTVFVVEAAKKEIARLQPELPPGTRIEIVRDASIMIRDSVHDVQVTLILGGILTIFIVFCFLNSWRSTVITGLTLPISVISSFIVMNFMGMTLNVMTLMALSLAIGLLIDDAIVVRENIVRHLEHGQDHFEAARAGTSEIGLAVIATTFSIVAVFVPVAFMKGIVGRFFFQFGITVAFAVLVSLFVSFTLDPMLSSRWIDPDIERKGKRHLIARILDRFNGWFDRTADRYRSVITWALGHRKTILALAMLAFFGGVLAFASLKTEFFTPVDRAEFQINFKSAPDASLVETRGRVGAVLSEIRKLREVRSTFATIGAGDAGTVRDGMVYVKLSEKKERKRRQDEIQKEVRERLGTIPGILPAIVEVGRMTGEKPFNVAVRGEDIGQLKRYAAALKREIRKIPGIVDLEVTLEHDVPEYRLTVDGERAADLGVTTGSVVRTVGALIGGQVVSTYEDPDGDAVNVRVRLPVAMRRDPSQVGRIRLAVNRGPEGASLVPLAEVATYAMSDTPAEINRQALTREVVLSANLDGLPLGEAMDKVKAITGRMSMAPGYRVVFTGEGEDMIESFGYMAEALLLAVIFVYLILAAQFESFIEPFAIMLSLPLSVVGMAGMLLLTGDTVNIMSLIGLIMLMGLVTKNAILLVDYAKVLQTRGMERAEAVITAGRTRLRPILMTTLAMIFGMLPLALGIGAGAEERAPMARAVVGGLVTSTFLTLLVVPVVYTLLDDFAAWMRRRWDGKKAVAGAVVGLLVLLHGIPFLGPPAAAAADSAALEILTLDEALRTAVESNRDVAKATELRTSLEGKYVEERAAALPQFLATAEALRAWDESQSHLRSTPRQQPVHRPGGRIAAPLLLRGRFRRDPCGRQRPGDGGRPAPDRSAHRSAGGPRGVFHDILLFRELNRIAVEDRAQKARHLDEARKKYAVGTATDYDVLAAEVALQNAGPEVVRTGNLVQISRERLRFLLGRDEQGSRRERRPLGHGRRPSGLREELATAVDHRPELSDLRNRQGVAQELLVIARTGNRPPAGIPRRSRLAGDRLRGRRPQRNNMVRRRVRLLAPFRRAPDPRACRPGRQRRANPCGSRRRNCRDGIALEVRNAVNAVREAGEIVNALAGTVDQAERLLAMAEKGYEYGVKTRLDVDDAQLNRSRALGNLARARRDYLVAGAALRHATGTLGDEIASTPGREEPFRPAGSPLGIALEVLGGRPALP